MGWVIWTDGGLGESGVAAESAATPFRWAGRIRHKTSRAWQHLLPWRGPISKARVWTTLSIGVFMPSELGSTGRPNPDLEWRYLSDPCAPIRVPDAANESGCFCVLLDRPKGEVITRVDSGVTIVT